MLNQTEILIVEDHPIVRVGFSTLLSQFEKNVRIHEADNSDQAIQLCLEYSPAVALVDLSLAGKFSLELIKKMHSLRPKTGILVVSMHDERIYAERALRAGASGYIMKHQAARSIIHAVRDIRDGKMWLSEEMHSAALQRFADRFQPEGSNTIELLSDRELEVFRMIGEGRKKAEIANAMELSLSTVETYRTNIKRKLGIDTGWALYRKAILHFSEQ